MCSKPAPGRGHRGGQIRQMVPASQWAVCRIFFVELRTAACIARRGRGMRPGPEGEARQRGGVARNRGGCPLSRPRPGRRRVAPAPSVFVQNCSLFLFFLLLPFRCFPVGEAHQVAAGRLAPPPSLHGAGASGVFAPRSRGPLFPCSAGWPGNGCRNNVNWGQMVAFSPCSSRFYCRKCNLCVAKQGLCCTNPIF